MHSDVVVDLFDEDLDAAEVERLTLSLRRELLDVNEVQQVAQAPGGPAPPGSRAIGLTEIGSLIVTVKPTIEVLVKVVGVLRSWMARRKVSANAGTTMRITVNGQTLELTPTGEQQQQLVEEFVKAAAASSTPTVPDDSATTPGQGTGTA
jgi:hypothetical protein